MNTQTVLQEISMAAQVAAPIAGAASPEAGLILGLTPGKWSHLKTLLNRPRRADR